MRGTKRKIHWGGLLCLQLAAGAVANPWLGPGDESVRADIELLSDAGVIRGPVTTWPLSWPDIARDTVSADINTFDDATSQALLRIQRLARAAAAPGFSGVGVRVSAALKPSELRTFADAPRDQGEVALRASWLSDHAVLNLEGTYASDPDDGRRVRSDGSYLGMNLGNYMLSAGYLDRWWGPGWDSSLILSTNARPIPAATIERNYSDPFESKWLSWIGRWRASIAVGRADDPDSSVRGVRFFAARVNFKPRPWLEFGLSRTAQWCGADRPCSWGTFTEMLLGRDNQTIGNSASATQPGNQMAGYDMRLRSPWRKLPLVFHTQWIGEDEAGGLPSKFLAQFGLETWGMIGSARWRMRAEYADTTCNFSRHPPEYGCAYRNTIYPQGYAYLGRIIGDSMDNDSRRYTIAGLVNFQNGSSASAALRRLDLNRDGESHAISRVPVVVDNVELRYSRQLWVGDLSVGIAYEHPSTQPSSSFHGFVNWQQGF